MPSFEELKGKYQSVIDLAKQRGVHLKNVNVQDDKLLIRGDAPSQDVKNEVWNRIKAIDPGYPDLIADIDIDSSLPQPAAQAQQPATQPLPAVGGGPQQQEYEVAPGDSLSKIARRFYGDASQYMRIFEANRDQLQDPDRIRVGQRLRIP